MKQTIYIDTSVVGGFFDEEFKEATQRLFDRLVNDEVRFVISDILELELLQAPQHVKDLLMNYAPDRFVRVEITQEAMELADRYIEEGVVGSTSLTDCRHIALATVHRLDVLASWNFKHIVNLERIKGYNSVNLRFGYPPIEIRTPKNWSAMKNKPKKEKAFDSVQMMRAIRDRITVETKDMSFEELKRYIALKLKGSSIIASRPR